MNKLNPIRLDLSQNSLIEASAGTGKTYTIATLYLRAILGLIAPEKPLTPIDIKRLLVVTFTDAATKELRDRLRSKLIEAQRYLILCGALEAQSTSEETAQALNKTDPSIKLLFADYQSKAAAQWQLTEQQANLMAYNQLQQALLFVDESAIFTIHGFCQKCLTQFAFETQSDFDRKMENDYLPVVNKALFDFWRKHIVALESIELNLFKAKWSTPKRLLADVQALMGKRIVVQPEITQAQYNKSLANYLSLLDELRTQWLEADFSAVLRSSGIRGTLNTLKAIPQLDAFLAGEVQAPSFKSTVSWQVWSSEIIANPKNYKKNFTCLEHPIVHLIDRVYDLEQRFVRSEFAAFWLAFAKQQIEANLKTQLTEMQIVTPDDLLTSLESALQADSSQRLIEALQSSYPLAFIDEFQDTDPIQYRIFSSIYGNASQGIEQKKHANSDDNERPVDAEQATASMVLIGDPKQAIYKFRGADIYTYIRAKQAITSDRHFTLDSNWRSHPELISAINYLFGQSPLQFEHDAIPFQPVNAGKRFDASEIPIDPQTPVFEVAHLINGDEPGKALSSKIANFTLAKWCALDIVKQLRVKEQAKNAVTTGDICVLVRTRAQAKLIKNALKQVNLESVFLSRESVFASPMAKTLFLVLNAVAHPHKEQAVKSALATILFQYSVAELLAIQKDPQQWQQKLDWFYTANRLLQSGKIVNAVDALMAQANTFAKWSEDRQLDFHRSVTDLRHLLEILQNQQQKYSGFEKLFLWFEQQISSQFSTDDSSNNDEQVLRLESDSNLIKIVTYHASKGLEFPYVYIPFGIDVKKATSALYTSEQDNQTYLRADNRLIELQYAEQERIAEDIRLLYVALTRPIYRLAIGVANINGNNTNFADTALARLMFGKSLAEISESSNYDEAIENYVLNMANTLNTASSEPQPQSAGVGYEQMTIGEVNDAFLHRVGADLGNQFGADAQVPSSALAVAPLALAEKTDWRILSYSMLSQMIGHHQVQTKPDVELIANKGVEVEHFIQELPTNVAAEEPLDQFHFPKGANAGTCLHWILEHIDFSVPLDQQQDIVERGLTKHGIDLKWLAVTISWLQAVVDNNQVGFSLKALAPGQFINELEFYFDFSALNSQVFGNALLMMGLDGLADKARTAGFAIEQGIVKGFIDVVIEANGKFNVVDYKSNYIGLEFSDYNQAALHENMLEHHYHLQALIYVLALHRFLQQRVPNYQFKQHIGGAIYFYLRGMNATDDKGIALINVKEDVVLYLDNALRKITSSGADMAHEDNGTLSVEPTLVVNAEPIHEMPKDVDLTTPNSEAEDDDWQQKGFDF